MRIFSKKTHFLGSFLSETRFFIPFYAFQAHFVQILRKYEQKLQEKAIQAFEQQEKLTKMR